MLFAIVLYRGTLSRVIAELARAPWRWMLWSVVGFGLFYIPLCICAKYAPAWLVAASWQFTMIAGSLLAPLFYEPTVFTDGPQRVPLRGLWMSCLILVGIVAVELGNGQSSSGRAVWLAVIPMFVAAFAYPLGNRKMMEVCAGRLGALERVFGMTLASMPLWITMSVVGIPVVGLPSTEQVTQSAIVALSSGVIATVLFFAATDLTKGNVHELAVIEATQSGEVIFTVLLGLLLISARPPSLTGIVGIGLIVVGMVGHSLWPAHKRQDAKQPGIGLEETQ